MESYNGYPTWPDIHLTLGLGHRYTPRNFGGGARHTLTLLKMKREATKPPRCTKKKRTAFCPSLINYIFRPEEGRKKFAIPPGTWVAEYAIPRQNFILSQSRPRKTPKLKKKKNSILSFSYTQAQRTAVCPSLIHEKKKTRGPSPVGPCGISGVWGSAACSGPSPGSLWDQQGLGP